MQTFETIEDAREAAKDITQAESIIEIAHASEGRLFIISKAQMCTLKVALERKPMPAIKELIEEYALDPVADAHEQALKDHERWLITHDEKSISLHWQQGTPLSAYAPDYGDYGIAGDILCAAGVAHTVSGWGTKVDDALVDALGEEIYYSDLMEYTRPDREADQAAEAEEAARREELQAAAERTGEPQLLEKHIAPCNDPREECSQDLVCTMIHADGSTATERTHTW